LKEEKGRRRTTHELRDLVRSVRSGELEYEERPRKSLDWSSYDEAQAYELADMLYLIRKLVDDAVNRLPEPERRRGRGRPLTHPPADVAKVLLMQSYFGVSNRAAAGLALVFKEKLRLSDAFSYKTIEQGVQPRPRHAGTRGGLQADQRVRGRERDDILDGWERGPHVEQGELRVSPL
jgi:hypothetical protein